MSRSRNVLTKPSRQAALSWSEPAKYARGKPPRAHNSRHESAPVSSTSKPPISTNSTRPASDSEAFFTSAGDALPRSRKRAFVRGRSASTRSAGKSAGMVWISSRTTTPSAAPSANSGFWRLNRCGSDSRSKKVARLPSPKRRASVVFPHCRGPRRATIGERRTASARSDRYAGRGIMCQIYSEYSDVNTNFRSKIYRALKPGGLRRDRAAKCWRSCGLSFVSQRRRQRAVG